MTEAKSQIKEAQSTLGKDSKLYTQAYHIIMAGNQAGNQTQKQNLEGNQKKEKTLYLIYREIRIRITSDFPSETTQRTKPPTQNSVPSEIILQEWKN